MRDVMNPRARAGLLGVLKGLALALAAALVPAAAAGQQVTTTLTSTADTYLRSNNTGTNYGTQTQLQVEPSARQTLVQFDLSSVPAGIVMSATLRLYVQTAGGTARIHRTTAAWTETGATWANMSTNYSATIEASGSPTTSQYLDFDITTLVRTWRLGTANYGVMVTGATGSTQSVFVPREGTAGTRPQLVIVTNGDPSYSVTKLTTVVSDPANGTTQPKRMPGAVIEHSVTVSSTNANVSDSNSIALVEAVPSETTLYVGDLGGGGSGPVTFTNGSPSSGLTYTYSGLSSGTDDLSFSSNGGVSWTYVPIPDADGYDTAVTHLRLNPKGVFAGNTGSGNPSFTYAFRAKNK